MGAAEQQDAHLLPKVMVPFLTQPGETPRKVQIQRCGRGIIRKNTALSPCAMQALTHACTRGNTTAQACCTG